jgi:hypothetical protein
VAAFDAEQLDAIRLAVRQELAALLGLTGPPPLPDRPALHVAPPIPTRPLGPLMVNGCEAVTYDGMGYARCRRHASTTREGHRCCGTHARPDRPEPRWAVDDGYSGI